MVYKKLALDISDAQARKATGGKMIALSAAQLTGGGKIIHLHPANYEKVQKAKKANRGVRLQIARGEMQHDLMQGGSVWSWLKDTLWPAVKPAVSGVVDAALPAVSQALGPYAPVAIVGRQALKGLTGIGVKGTPEMKAKMAKVRSAKRGGSFKQSGGSMRAGSFKL